MNEKELKEIGEELAEAAAKAGVGSKQLRELLRLAKTRPTPFLEARVEYQIARAATGGRGGPRGFDRFGPTMLDVIEKLKDDKGGLQKALLYANMLYPYVTMTLEGGMVGRRAVPGGQAQVGHRRQAFEGRREGAAGWREKLDPIVGGMCSRFGYGGVTVEDDMGRLLCRVMLRRFHGNPAVLASDLYREAVSHFPELTRSIRFWIERT